MKKKKTKIDRNHQQIRKFLSQNIMTIACSVITGIIVAVITLNITDTHNKMISDNELVNSLKNIRLGQSWKYIDEQFGVPLIESDLTDYASRNDIPSGNYSNAGYKLDNCVILCLFDDNSLVAYVIVVNQNGIYQIPNSNETLMDFTYSDFCSNIILGSDTRILGHDTRQSAYNTYAEFHPGANINHNHATILGSYMYDTDPDTNQIYYELKTKGSIVTSYYETDWIDSIDVGSYEQEINELRQNYYPNVYGVVTYELSKTFDYCSDIVQSDERAELLFGDWWVQ